MIFIIDPKDELPAGSKARAAIVTLVVGELHTKVWTHVCSSSWISYAERTGLDIIVLTARIDETDVARSPAWQKLLILDLPWACLYERIIWLDSDILITDMAPHVLEFAGPAEKVGLCIDCARMSAAEAQVFLEVNLKVQLSPDGVDTDWHNVQRNRYRDCGLPEHDVMFNTGVMVLSPRHHNELLKSAYGAPQFCGLFEQPQLSDLLLSQDLAYVMSPRFNWGVIEPIQLIVTTGSWGDESPEFIGQLVRFIVRAQFRCAYFLHFYGAMDLLRRFADIPGKDPAEEARAA